MEMSKVVTYIVAAFYYYCFIDSNILVHQICMCKNPLLCTCPVGEAVTYVLGDIDLFCIDGEHLSGKYVEWAKAKRNEPAGSPGLKASEVCLLNKLS